MAFKIRQLQRVASVSFDDNGTSKKCNWYVYATTDADATVQAAGYFNDARDTLSVGDTIEAMTALAGTPERVVMRVTAVPTTGNVTVAVDAGTDDTA